LQYRVVSFEQGEQKAKEFGMEFIETSAKTGFNIKSLFHRVVVQLGLQNALPTNIPDGYFELTLILFIHIIC
jgi:Ras-related protein Rab-6A